MNRQQRAARVGEWSLLVWGWGGDVMVQRWSIQVKPYNIETSVRLTGKGLQRYSDLLCVLI